MSYDLIQTYDILLAKEKVNKQSRTEMIQKVSKIKICNTRVPYNQDIPRSAPSLTKSKRKKVDKLTKILVAYAMENWLLREKVKMPNTLMQDLDIETIQTTKPLTASSQNSKLTTPKQKRRLKICTICNTEFQNKAYNEHINFHYS